MIRALALAFVLTLIGPALAHRHERPDLNGWFDKLKSDGGAPCCDYNEAVAVDDPDWKTDTEDCQITTTGQDNETGHYCVNIKGTWWLVPDRALVSGANKFGQAVIWSVEYPPSADGKPNIFIRCFMPGPGA